MHDQEAYLKTKLEDLPGQCPTWRRQGGRCRCGITCRFAASHVPMTEAEIAAEKVADDLLAATERNALSDEARRQLRRGGGYQFPKAAAFKKALEASEAAAGAGAGAAEASDAVPVIRLGAVADAEKKQVCVGWRRGCGG